MTLDPLVHTVYLRNLNEKISIRKLTTLLQAECSKFGKVLHITAHRNLKMRGQAFVTFDSPQASGSAVSGLNSRVLLGKPVVADLAITESDAYFAQVLHDDAPIIARKDRKRSRQEDPRADSQKPKLSLSNPTSKSTEKPAVDLEWKKAKPNKVLLLLNISLDIDQTSLEDLFEDQDGFESARYIAARQLAFITFESADLARACIESMLPQHIASQYGPGAMLTYAKK